MHITRNIINSHHWESHISHHIVLRTHVTHPFAFRSVPFGSASGHFKSHFVSLLVTYVNPELCASLTSVYARLLVLWSPLGVTVLGAWTIFGAHATCNACQKNLFAILCDKK